MTRKEALEKIQGEDPVTKKEFEELRQVLRDTKNEDVLFYDSEWEISDEDWNSSGCEWQTSGC